VPRDGIEPPTRGFSGKTPEFPNFLKRLNLLKLLDSALSDFRRWSTF
jgi:hypothetical protein